MLDDLKNEKLSLEFFLRHRKTEMPEHLKLLEESTEIQKLISPYFIPIDKELKKWMEEPYEKCKEFLEHLKIHTYIGIKVRSKSEAFICNQLHMHKIPFRYECALYLGRTPLYPDFTILHPQTEEIFYWEHFGMMDDPSYGKNAVSKLQTYISHGFIPSIHLITTYETAQNPLSTEIVQKTIEHYFL